MHIFILGHHLGSGTVEDVGEEVFPDGVDVKLKKWARGRGEGRCSTPK